MENKLLLEYAAISIIVIVETGLFITTYQQIISFKKIFASLPILRKHILRVKEGSENSVEIFASDNIEHVEWQKENTIQLIVYNGKSAEQASIVKTINNYLIKNRGAAIDYHILKEIVNQRVESLETIIETRIPSPLYFGLAGTMIGIILGLFKVDLELTSIDGIRPLIDGVKIAMIASLMGLLYTTFLSIFIFKKAKESAEQGKIDFLSFVQADLLPNVTETEQSGIVLLSQKLDDFGRNTYHTIENLNQIVENSKNQVHAGQSVLNQIEKLNLKNVTAANLKIFKQLEAMIENFQAFPKYYNNLNKSLSKTSTLINSLDELLSRTDKFESGLDELKGNLKTSNAASEFFNNHIQDFQRYGTVVNESVLSADESMQKAIGALEQSSLKFFQGIGEQISSYDQQLNESFANSIENYNRTTDKISASIAEKLENAQPQLSKLEKLTDISIALETLDSNLGKNFKQLSHSFNDKLDVLISTTAKRNQPGSGIDGDKIQGHEKLRRPWYAGGLDITTKVVLLLAGLTIISYGVHTVYIYWLK